MTKLFAILLILSLAKNSSGAPLFMVQSNNEKLNIPITLCLDGKNIIGCQNYMVNGTHLEIKTLTTVYTSFMNAGIEVHASGYKLEGCMPYSNKYCIFSANSYYPVSVVLK